MLIYIYFASLLLFSTWGAIWTRRKFKNLPKEKLYVNLGHNLSYWVFNAALLCLIFALRFPVMLGNYDKLPTIVCAFYWIFAVILNLWALCMCMSDDAELWLVWLVWSLAAWLMISMLCAQVQALLQSFTMGLFMFQIGFLFWAGERPDAYEPPDDPWIPPGFEKK